MAPQKKSNAPAKSNGPVFRIASGVLSVSIWEQNGSNGTFYTTTAQRAFKRDDASEWEHTDSFNRDDLPVVALLMQSAWTAIIKKEADARREQK